MAVRIRKLARELDRTPAEILGILGALGIQRYRTPDDMLTPDVEAKVRRGVQKGLKPLPVQLPAGERAPEASAAVGPDLMAALVPGAVPVGKAAPPRARPTPSLVAPTPSPVVPSAPPSAARERTSDAFAEEDAAVLGTERAALDSMRRTLASERNIIEAEREQVAADAARVAARERSLAAQHEALRELQFGLDRERVSLEAEKVALSELRQRSAASAAVPLEDLLEARGLRGMDEYERVLVVLAQQRVLRDVLWTVRVDAPDHFRRLLDDRLVLVDGVPPETVTRHAGVVQVAPERAEVADGARHDAAMARLGESLLLRGIRRLLVVGGKPRWQRVLRHGIDPRVEVRVAPSGPRTRDVVMDDVRWADCIVLWNANVGGEATGAYTAAKKLVLVSEAPSWAVFVQDLTKDLNH